MELPVISLQGNRMPLPTREGEATGGRGSCRAEGLSKDTARAESRPSGKTRLGGSLALPLSSPGVSGQWKSLEQCENSAKFRRRAANKFLPGALDEPGDVSR